MAKIKKRLKNWIKAKLKNTYLEFEALNKEDDENLVLYFPYKRSDENYIIKNIGNEQIKEQCEYGLPIPPPDLWLGYGQNTQEYLYGKEQIGTMIKILANNGYEISKMKNILDFGCGAGRMIRWLRPFADNSEIWGVDISADHITWAINNLNPPFKFATTTIAPHLPFEERHFDFIYAGSVFTHIDDLVESWMLELRRILSDNGTIYITIQDKNSLKELKTSIYYKDIWLKKYVEENPFFNLAGNEFDKLVGMRGINSQVFYDPEYFKKIAVNIFEIVEMHEKAYGFQTAVLMKKKASNMKTKL